MLMYLVRINGDKMKNTKKIIIILTFFIVIIGSVTIFASLKKNNKLEKEKNKNTQTIEESNVDASKLRKDDVHYDNGFSIIETKAIDACYDKNNCNYKESLFYHYAFQNSSKTLITELTKLNKTSDSYYNLMNKSTLNSNECSKVMGMYNKKDYYYLFPISYVDDNYFSLVTLVYKTNLCNGVTTALKIDGFVYDRKKDKILSNDELLKIKSKDIEESLKSLDYKIYFNDEGQLILNYVQNGEYVENTL